jgi:hypothetical protein
MSVLRRFGVFEQALVDALHFGHAYAGDLLYRAVPALFEWLFDQSPPGGGAQVCYGHDHSGNAADPAGKAIPRNAIVSGGHGAGDQYLWEVALNGAAGFYSPADADAIIPRSGLVAAGGLGYMIQAYVDEDLDTDTYPALFTEGKVALWIEDPNNLGTFHCNVKITNLTPGIGTTDSAITHFHQFIGIQWFPISEIPVKGGVWNQFNIELENAGLAEDPPIVVRCYGYLIAEVYRGGSFADTAHATPLTQTPQVGNPG